MATELEALTLAVERMLTEHTRLSVENKAMQLRVRELEAQAQNHSERVQQAKLRLDALMAQLPLDAPATAPTPLHANPQGKNV